MTERPSAIVIGAGIGGLAVAGRLARAGFQVDVFEKNERPGGRADVIERDGHRFDVGPTLFLMPEVFEETYQALGSDMEVELDLQRIDPTYRIYFPDGSDLELTSDMNQMQAQLEAMQRGAFGGFLRYMAEGSRHYRVSLERFVGRNFRSLFEYFSPRNLPLLFQLKALVKHYDNIGSYFDDPRLKAAFTFQNMYLGLSPYDAPATFSLLQYTELADGVWYPMGGMYAVVQSLERIDRQLGARFHYSSPVAHIETAGDRAGAVILEDGRRFEADVVIANADLPYVYKELLKDETEYARLERKKYTSSTIMFYWGVDRRYPRLGHHNVFLAGDYRASFQRIFDDNSLPDEPSFYVHAPARTDPEAAPPGEDSLYVLVPVGHLDDSAEQNWPDRVTAAREAVFERLARMGVHDLREHIKFEITYTPETWREAYNLDKGAAFGLSHNFLQVGYLRPKNRHARLKNLYFVGASTHPGTGLPIVLLSARLTSERILEELPASEKVKQLKPAAEPLDKPIGLENLS